MIPHGFMCWLHKWEIYPQFASTVQARVTLHVISTWTIFGMLVMLYECDTSCVNLMYFTMGDVAKPATLPRSANPSHIHLLVHILMPHHLLVTMPRAERNSHAWQTLNDLLWGDSLRRSLMDKLALKSGTHWRQLLGRFIFSIGYDYRSPTQNSSYLVLSCHELQGHYRTISHWSLLTL